MTSLPDSARAVLESPALGHLVTLNPDGSPQLSIVWVGLDGDEIVAGHLPEHRKVRNIRNDSRVALSIETGKRNAMGLNEYLVIYGTARITEGGAAELLQKLARAYLGPGVRFPPMDNPPPGFITHIGSPVWAPGQRRIKDCMYQPRPARRSSRAEVHRAGGEARLVPGSSSQRRHDGEYRPGRQRRAGPGGGCAGPSLGRRSGRLPLHREVGSR
jgi:PPOX class probable F420-dependent enzyme